MRRRDILGELVRIKRKHRGLLLAEHVVAEAEPEDSPLHACFTWDDTEAAAQYRLWQARHLIRVSVTVLPQMPESPIKAFVSLMGDRRRQGGGYRALVDVLGDEAMRAALLQEALEELRVFEDKYKALSELAPLFHVAHSISQKRKRKAG